MDTAVHYTSANHAHQVIEQINQLRQNRELCDIILRCNNHRIAAHKLILSVNSPYFRSLMNNRYYNEPGLYEHRLPGIEGKAVQQIVEFFYTSAVSVNEESVWTLLPAASKLHVAEIQNLCSEYLISQLQLENCLKIHKLATECLSSNLLKESTDFIKENFEKILEEDSFLDLEFKEAMPHLKRLGDTGITNDQILQAIKCWIIASVDDRQVYGYKIIRMFSNLASKLEEFIPGEFLEVDQDEIGRRILQERERIEREALLTPNAEMDSPRLSNGRNHSASGGKKGVKRKAVDDAEFDDSERILMKESFEHPLNVDTRQAALSKGSPQITPKTDHIKKDVEKNNNIHSRLSNGENSDVHMCSECAEEFDSKSELEEHVATHKVIIKRENISPTSQNGNLHNAQGPSRAESRSLSPSSTSRNYSPTPNSSKSSARNFSPSPSVTSVISQNPLLNRSNSPYEDFIKMNNLDASRNMSYLSGGLKTGYGDESAGSYFDNYMRARGLDSPSFGQSRSTWSPQPSNTSHSGQAKASGSSEDGNDFNFVCPTCGKSYLDKDSLGRHIATHSTFPCPVCGKTYSTKSNLQTHMKKHSDENIFSCNTCEKSFISASVLKAHLRTHTGEKPFTCPTCGVAFAKNIHLKRHLSIHTGIKPHECHVCSKRFSRSDHLKRHIQSIHTQERPHVCSICNKDFVRKYELNKHMKQCHYGMAVTDDDHDMNSSTNDSYNDSFGDPPSQIVRSLLPKLSLFNNSEAAQSFPRGTTPMETSPNKNDGQYTSVKSNNSISVSPGVTSIQIKSEPVDTTDLEK